MNPVQTRGAAQVSQMGKQTPEEYNFYLISSTINLTTTGFQFNFLEFVKLIEIPF